MSDIPGARRECQSCAKTVNGECIVWQDKPPPVRGGICIAYERGCDGDYWQAFQAEQSAIRHGTTFGQDGHSPIGRFPRRRGRPAK